MAASAQTLSTFLYSYILFNSSKSFEGALEETGAVVHHEKWQNVANGTKRFNFFSC